MGDLGSISGLGRSLGEGKDYPLQYSGLENSMHYIAHVIAKSQIQLSDFHFHYFHNLETICKNKITEIRVKENKTHKHFRKHKIPREHQLSIIELFTTMAGFRKCERPFKDQYKWLHTSENKQHSLPFCSRILNFHNRLSPYYSDPHIHASACFMRAQFYLHIKVRDTTPASRSRPLVTSR